MANLLYQNNKIYKKIQELSKEIQENIELLEQEERTRHQKHDQNPYTNQPQNIILTIKDNESIVIKKESTIQGNKTPIEGQSQEKRQSQTKRQSQEKRQSQNEKNYNKPPAGRLGTRWDPTIIHWKNSLRGYYFF